MKTTVKFFALLTVVLTLAACDKDKEAPRHERDIVYTVDGQTTTVQLTTEAEWDALLEQFCDWAEDGSTVSFYNAKHKIAKSATKDVTEFSTTSRDEMKRWMARMEDEGKTVTVTYDSNTGTWNGMAYTTALQPEPVPDTVMAPLFSVSATRQVTFATGNLQYCAATGEYRVAASQYTTLCVTTDTIWTDLFEQDTVSHLGNEWRLLTKAEATYLLELRFCSTVAGVENARYARAKVADVHGIILFPDRFVWPGSVALPVGVNNNGFSNAEGWNDNDYSVADWQQLEAAGAVFLPGTNPCYYGEMSLYYADGIAAYWTSTPDQILVSGPSQVGTNSSWENEKHAIRYIRDNQ